MKGLVSLYFLTIFSLINIYDLKFFGTTANLTGQHIATKFWLENARKVSTLNWSIPGGLKYSTLIGQPFGHDVSSSSSSIYKSVTNTGHVIFSARRRCHGDAASIKYGGYKFTVNRVNKYFTLEFLL